MLAASAFLAAPAGASNQSVTFTVTPIHFGTVVLGASSTRVSIVTNTSAVPLYLIGAHPAADNVGAEYHATAGTCVGAIAPSGSCDLDVTFAPNAVGLRASTLTVRLGEKNAKGNVIAAASVGAPLVGHGVKPTFTLTGGTAGNVVRGQIGTADATITNTSPLPLVVRSAVLVGVNNHDFAISSVSCPSPVLPGGSCAVIVAFTPRVLGSASVTLTVAMDLQGTNVQTVRSTTLTGVGIRSGNASPPFTLSPLNFGSVTVGESATGQVVLTNTSANNETFDSDAILNNGWHAYAIVGNSCTTAIAPTDSCDLTVSYSPAAAVVHNATLVAHVTFVNAKGATVVGTAQTSLTGQGVQPQFSLAASSFPTTTVGASSTGTVTVTNDSLVALSFSSSSFQGSDPLSWSLLSAAECTAAPIPPQQSCDLSVAFSPREQGKLSITIQVNLQLTVRGHTSTIVRRAGLFGEAVLPSFSVSAPSFSASARGIAVIGQSVVTNNSNVSLSYDSFGFSGTNAADFTVIGGSCVGATIAPTDSCDLTVQFTPSLASAGTESATLRVTMLIVGLTPPTFTANSVAVTGQES